MYVEISIQLDSYEVNDMVMTYLEKRGINGIFAVVGANYNTNGKFEVKALQKEM